MSQPPARTARSLADLAALGLLPAAAEAALTEVAARYAIAVTPGVAAAIDRTDPADPLALQYLPDARELDRDPSAIDDPIGDERFAVMPGLVHRYPDRVLLMPVANCAVYCRFCFRRERVGPSIKALDEAAIAAAVDYVAGQPGVFEVILTGGDPLMLPAARLDRILSALTAIAHVGVIRIHSRIPVADPDRIDDAAIAALSQAAAAKTLVLAVHCNHAREIGPAAAGALKRLAGAGIALAGQSVLLRGVNDSVEALESLMRAMLAHRIRPYYLHQLDRAPGTEHFRVPIAEGRRLVASLRGRLSGLGQPTYVLDLPGGEGKSPLTADWVDEAGDGRYRVADWRGGRHDYDEGGRQDGSPSR